MCSWFRVLKCVHDSAWWRKTKGIRCRFNPPSCHSARRACPKLQNPHFKTRKITFSLERKWPSGRMRGEGKCSSMALSHHLRRPHLSRKARAIFSMMDSATSPFGSAQNDREGGMLWRMKVLWLEKPTEWKSVAMSIDFLMMLCALVRNDAECIG